MHLKKRFSEAKIYHIIVPFLIFTQKHVFTDLRERGGGDIDMREKHVSANQLINCLL